MKKELLEIEFFIFFSIFYLVGLDKIIFSYMSTFIYFFNFLFDGKSFFTLNELLTNDIQLTVSKRKDVLSYCLKNNDKIGYCMKP